MDLSTPTQDPARSARARRVWYVYTAWWEFAGTLSWTTTTVLFVRELGMSPLLLVLAGTALEVAYLLAEIPTGVLADLYSRKASLVVAALVIGAAMLLTGVAPVAWVALAASALWGVGWTFRSGAEDAWLADEVGADALGPVYQRSAQVGRVAGLAGIGAAVLLAGISLRLPLLASGVLALALAGYLVVAMREDGFVRPSRPEHATGFRTALGTLTTGVRTVRTTPVLVLVLFVVFGIGAWAEGFDRLWQAHLMLDVGLSGAGGLDEIQWFGLLAAGTLVLSFLAAAPLVPRIEALSPAATARWLMWLHAGLAAASLCFALAGTVWVAVLTYLLTTVVRDLTWAPFRAWLNAAITDSSVRATVLSLTGVAGSAGEWAGGPVLGVAANRWSIRAALAAGSLLLLPVVGLFARAVRHHGRVD